MNYIPTSQKGAANGVAALDANKRISEDTAAFKTVTLGAMAAADSSVTISNASVSARRFGKLCMVYGQFTCTKTTTGNTFKVTVENLDDALPGNIQFVGTGTVYNNNQPLVVTFDGSKLTFMSGESLPVNNGVIICFTIMASIS